MKQHMQRVDEVRNCGTGTCRSAAFCGLLAVLAYAPHAQAIQVDYGVGAGVEYSDNISLVRANEQDDTGVSLQAGFSLLHSTSVLDADIRSGIEYLDYTNDVFSDETLGSLRADVTWRPIPGVLHWQLEDYFTQTVRSSIVPETPDNRIDANAFSTGPDIFVRIDPVTTIEAQLRRADYYFEDTPTDSYRNIASVGWVRALRPELDVSANVAYQDANFTETDNIDFTRLDYFVRADSRRGRSELLVDIGLSQIDRDNSEDLDGFLGRLLLTRQVGVYTTLNLEVSSQYTDSGIDLLMAGATPFELDRADEQVSGDLFKDNRIEARYHTGTADRNWGAYLQLRDEDYELLDLDRESAELRLDMHRNLSASLYLNGYVMARREKYTDLSRTNKDAEMGVGLERRMTRNITARLDYAHNTRNSSDAFFDYDENRVFFLIYYGRNPATFR